MKGESIPGQRHSLCKGPDRDGKELERPLGLENGRQGEAREELRSEGLQSLGDVQLVV